MLLKWLNKAFGVFSIVHMLYTYKHLHNEPMSPAATGNRWKLVPRLVLQWLKFVSLPRDMHHSNFLNLQSWDNVTLALQ